MGDNKQLARNMIFNTLSFGMNFAISFFLAPYLVKEVGREAYGFIPLIGNMIGYTSVITTAIGSMAGRFITMKIYQNDHEGASTYYNSVLVANLVLSAFFTVLAVVALCYLPYILNIPNHLLTEVRLMFAITALSMLLGLSTGILGCGAIIKNRMDVSTSRGMIQNFVRVALTLLLFICFKPSVVYISFAALISAFIGVYYNFSFKRRFLPEISFKPKKYFSWDKLKEVTLSGIWNSINQLSNLLLYQIDLLITNIFISAAATGEFSLSKATPTLILTFLATLSGSFYPKFNILYAEGKKEELNALVQKSIKIVGLFVSIAIGVLIVFSDSFYQLWLPGENAEKLQWLTIITVTPMIFGGSINPVFGLFATANRLKVPSLVLLFAGIANTLVILILLNTTNLGIWAIAITSAVQGALRNALFSPIYGAKCIGQKWYTFFPYMFKAICALTFAVTVGIGVKSTFQINGWFSFFGIIALVATVSLIINLFVVFNKSDRSYLKYIINNKLKRQ
ncbi:MAG: oligosaccharide flippase family protein [Bacteroidaceae bacterium]|nr:oligosaccharide flippase family protein [Bacteroidaceae bacterium]